MVRRRCWSFHNFTNGDESGYDFGPEAEVVPPLRDLCVVLIRIPAIKGWDVFSRLTFLESRPSKHPSKLKG